MASSAAFAQSATASEKVITFVQKAPAATERVVVNEKVVVGQPLPDTVVSNRAAARRLRANKQATA